MVYFPVPIIFSWLFGLLSLAILGTAGYLAWSWWDLRDALAPAGDVLVDADPQNWRIWTAAGLLAFALFGRLPILMFLGKGGDKDAPKAERNGEVHVLTAPDGAKLHAEVYGPKGAPALVLTHGWGLDSTAWWSYKRELSKRFRVIVWDLPGLGKSTQPGDGKYAMERFAENLRTVLSLAERQPVVLVGHSIGGMTNLTFCRDFPETLGKQVVGVVQCNTTYKDPTKTIFWCGLQHALKNPVGVPLLHLVKWLSPLVRLQQYLSYMNGTAHLMTRLTGFSKAGTRARIDFATRLGSKHSPAVQAKGILATFPWDCSDVLPTLRIPVRILSGEDDVVTKPAASRTMESRIPGSNRTEFDPAGHMGFMERDTDYIREIEAFADQAIARARAQGPGAPADRVQAPVSATPAEPLQPQAPAPPPQRPRTDRWDDELDLARKPAEAGDAPSDSAVPRPPNAPLH